MKVGDLVRFKKDFSDNLFSEEDFGETGLVLRIWKLQGWQTLQAEVLWSSGKKWSQSTKLLEVINESR